MKTDMPYDNFDDTLVDYDIIIKHGDTKICLKPSDGRLRCLIMTYLPVYSLASFNGLIFEEINIGHAAQGLIKAKPTIIKLYILSDDQIGSNSLCSFIHINNLTKFKKEQINFFIFELTKVLNSGIIFEIQAFLKLDALAQV
jgi:hypothetical protein